IAVIALVGDGRPGLEALEPGGALTDIRRLAGREEEPHRVAQGIDDDGDLGAESAARSPPGLLVGPPFFPAACRCARTTELSSRPHSGSGSCSASKTRCQTPLRAQRSERRQTEFHGPKRSGRSRQGAPVLAIHKTALRKRRLSLAVTPGCPGCP